MTFLLSSWQDCVFPIKRSAGIVSAMVLLLAEPFEPFKSGGATFGGILPDSLALPLARMGAPGPPEVTRDERVGDRLMTVRADHDCSSVVRISIS